MPDSKKIGMAIEALRDGRPILVFDFEGREGEADIIVHASSATPDIIAMMRQDAGGLVCLATDNRVAKKIGLPYLADLYSKNSNPLLRKIAYGKTRYGDKPAFSVSINSVKAFTGITDNDRAMTAKAFAKVAESANGMKKEFEGGFKSPGHVQLLIGKGLKHRKGHTELSLELARKAGLAPAVLLCEMLCNSGGKCGRGCGKALAKKEADEYARKNRLVFIEGRDIIA
ncbi:3,4-dihydroxy-2-butanone-4-phosphate synthase [Candidatus Parvarchaeota archaeon]|nr:3,4-dihydroxy-2-butanone-4-phosphate synthase [Candidatus Parvarchaeota archaeon]